MSSARGRSARQCEAPIQAINPIALPPHTDGRLLANMAQDGAELGRRPCLLPTFRLPLTEAAIDVTPVRRGAAGHGHVLSEERDDWLWIDSIQ